MGKEAWAVGSGHWSQVLVFKTPLLGGLLGFRCAGAQCLPNRKAGTRQQGIDLGRDSWRQPPIVSVQRYDDTVCGTFGICTNNAIKRDLFDLTGRYILYNAGTQSPPSRCPEPLLFQDSGSTLSEPEPARCGCANAVP